MGVRSGLPATTSGWPVLALPLALLACTAGSGSDRNENASNLQDSTAQVADNECERINARAERDTAAIVANNNLSKAEREIALTRIAGATGQCGMRPVPAGTPAPADISPELAAIYLNAVNAGRRSGSDGACRTAIGSTRADALEAICLQTSGAAHPPCNAANSCDMLVEEVDRNCSGDMGRRYPRLCSAAQSIDISSTGNHSQAGGQR